MRTCTAAAKEGFRTASFGPIGPALSSQGAALHACCEFCDMPRTCLRSVPPVFLCMWQGWLLASQSLAQPPAHPQHSKQYFFTRIRGLRTVERKFSRISRIFKKNDFPFFPRLTSQVEKFGSARLLVLQEGYISSSKAHWSVSNLNKISLMQRFTYAICIAEPLLRLIVPSRY